MIEAGLYNLLVTTEAVAALVGTHVYPVRLPEKVGRPTRFILFRLDSTEFEQTGLDDEGATAEQLGPDTGRYRLECWGDGPDGYKQSCTLAAAVVSLWRTQKGLLGVNTALKTKHSVVEDVRDEEFEQVDAMDSRRFLRVVDIAVEYDPAQV